MSDRPAITGIRFTPSSDVDRERGLLGFIRCVIDGRLVLDGITLRRTLDNRLTLSFPEREDGLGRRHPIIRPVDDEARRAIEAAILGSLGWSKAS
jgi:DNA-binding cell septation regulator SpoVG